MLNLELGHEVVYKGMRWKVSNHDVDKILYTLRTDYGNEHGYIETSITNKDLLEHMVYQPRLEELVDALEVGEKYTIIKYGSVGGLISIPFRHVSAEVARFAQYPRAVHLEMKRKMQRLNEERRITPEDAMLVYQGWIDVGIRFHDTSGFHQSMMQKAKKTLRGKIVVDASKGWLCN